MRITKRLLAPIRTDDLVLELSGIKKGFELKHIF